MIESIVPDSLWDLLPLLPRQKLRRDRFGARDRLPGIGFARFAGILVETERRDHQQATCLTSLPQSCSFFALILALTAHLSTDC
jgi:hypothetical protein